MQIFDIFLQKKAKIIKLLNNKKIYICTLFEILLKTNK